MSTRAGLILSIVALALSLANAVVLYRASDRSAAELPRHPLSPAGPSADTPACEGGGPLSKLSDLMKNRLNPAVTQMSFALHHDQGPAEDRLKRVARQASVVRGCVELAPSFRPNISMAEMGEYFRMMDSMRANALALELSALEHDEPQARHWFDHLKQDCAACHGRFRSASETAAE